MNKNKLPDGWREVKLHEVATIQTGFAKNTSQKGNLIELPYLRVANVQDGYLDLTEIKNIKVPLEKKDNFILKKNDILLTEGGDFDKLGRGTIWDGQIKDCLHQNHIFVVRTNSEFLLPKYLTCQTSGPIGRTYFLYSSKKSTNLASINSSQLNNFPIILPPLPEQNAIADTLSVWDTMIEKTEQLIAEKEKLFKSYEQKLIMKPATSKKWNTKKAGKLFTERIEMGRKDLPLLSITGSNGVIPHLDTNRKDSSSEDKSKYLRICKGDIGYNTMRMWQGVSALSELEGIVSPAYTICIPSKELFPQFIAYLFKTPFMIHRFYKYSQGLTSDTWNLKFNNFSEVTIPFPDLHEQRRIAEILDSAQREIDLLKQLLEHYKKQKRGLMQKLLTGAWRIQSK